MNVEGFFILRGLMRYVYGLGDPTIHVIKYIGQTNNVMRRYAEHIEDDCDTTKVQWIKGLQRRGHQPYLIVLDTCQDYQIDTLEKWWIQFGAQKGWQLTNGTFTGVKRKRRLYHVGNEAIKTIRLALALAVVLVFLYMMIGR